VENRLDISEVIDKPVMVVGIVETGHIKGRYGNENFIVVWDEAPTALPGFGESHGNKAMVIYHDAITLL
jgi:hypothetical protein